MEIGGAVAIRPNLLLANEIDLFDCFAVRQLRHTSPRHRRLQRFTTEDTENIEENAFYRFSPLCVRSGSRQTSGPVPDFRSGTEVWRLPLRIRPVNLALPVMARNEVEAIPGDPQIKALTDEWNAGNV